MWLRRGEALFTVSSPFEERDVWRLRLKKILESTNSSVDDTPELVQQEEDAFDVVVSLCQKASERAVVNLCRAEFHLLRKRENLAARWLARAPKSLAPFSETALRLCLPRLLGDEGAPSTNSALITYLTETFGRLSKQRLPSARSGDDNVQLAMLGAWLTELLLADRPLSGGKGDAVIGSFLGCNGKMLDSATTLKVLSSHDAQPHEIAAASAASGDYASAVSHALAVKSSSGGGRKGAIAALRILENAQVEKFGEVYYRHAAELFIRAPIEASESFLKRYKDGLEPEKLLPSILYVGRMVEKKREEEEEEEEEDDDNEAENREGGDAAQGTGTEHTIEDLQEEGILRYLEGVAKAGCESTAVHNYLVTLYLELEDEQPLFRYLTNITTSGDKPPLDLSFSLRCILKTQRHHRSAVKVYMALGMRRAAVELALKVDPSLARELARNTVGQEKKKLWCMIAEGVASDSSPDMVVDKVIGVLRESGEGVLSIEDVLPFLPDFTRIDAFKEEICSALTVYSDEINRYKDAMSECDAACEEIREGIEAIKKKRVEVRRSFKCELSGKDIMVDGVEVNDQDHYYSFPTGFSVLNSSLRPLVYSKLGPAEKSSLLSIETEMSSVLGRIKSREGMGGLGGLGKDRANCLPIKEESKDGKRLEELKAKYDDIVSRECPITGTLMIDTIDEPIEGWDVVDDALTGPDEEE